MEIEEEQESLNGEEASGSSRNLLENDSEIRAEYIDFFSIGRMTERRK